MEKAEVWPNRVMPVAMSFELSDLTGKHALVTGSRPGIGFAIAKGLAQHRGDIVLMSESRIHCE